MLTVSLEDGSEDENKMGKSLCEFFFYKSKVGDQNRG